MIRQHSSRLRASLFKVGVRAFAQKHKLVATRRSGPENGVLRGAEDASEGGRVGCVHDRQEDPR